VLCTIEEVAGYTHTVVGESAEWTAVVSTTEENLVSYYKALSGKTLFSALYGTYTVALEQLRALLKAPLHHKSRRSLPRRRASKKFGGANATTATRQPGLQRRYG
jgi:hypothetical protein